MTCQNSDSERCAEAGYAVGGKFHASTPHLDPGELGLFPKRRRQHRRPGWTAARESHLPNISEEFRVDLPPLRARCGSAISINQIWPFGPAKVK